MICNPNKPLTFTYVEEGGDAHLELRNNGEEAMKSVEVLTVFLKDLDGGPSHAHITFAEITSLRPRENALLSYKTWVNGKVVASREDLLERLKVVAGEVKPYVLDVSWQNLEGKSRFQSIPVGH